MKKILIVDHDREILRVLAEYVGMCGYEAEKVEDSEKVIPLATELKPAAILLDVCMPGKSGLDLLGELRKIDPELPVIMMSGQGDPVMVPRVFQMGARDYLMKPFDFARLRQALEEVSGGEKVRTSSDEASAPETGEANLVFISAAEYVRAFRDSEHGDLSFVPMSLAAEYLGMTPTGVTQLARRGGMREIVVEGPTKKWIGIGVWSLIRHRENASNVVPDLADRVKGVLESFAADRRICGLLDIMRHIGLDSRVPQNRRVVHEALALISAQTYRKRGFLLSAVCAMTSLGKPSVTFLGLAERLGALKGDVDRDRFLKAQLRKVFNHYRREPGGGIVKSSLNWEYRH